MEAGHLGLRKGMLVLRLNPERGVGLNCRAEGGGGKRGPVS